MQRAISAATEVLIVTYMVSEPCDVRNGSRLACKAIYQRAYSSTHGTYMTPLPALQDLSHTLAAESAVDALEYYCGARLGLAAWLCGDGRSCGEHARSSAAKDLLTNPCTAPIFHGRISRQCDVGRSAA